MDSGPPVALRPGCAPPVQAVQELLQRTRWIEVVLVTQPVWGRSADQFQGRGTVGGGVDRMVVAGAPEARGRVLHGLQPVGAPGPPLVGQVVPERVGQVERVGAPVRPWRRVVGALPEPTVGLLAFGEQPPDPFDEGNEIDHRGPFELRGEGGI